MAGQISAAAPMGNQRRVGQVGRTKVQTGPRSLLLGSLTACLALAVYLVSIAPDITWANYSSDGAELITASITLGIAHPPGYPTYILLGKLFSLLPFGTTAFRFNLFSALAMAVAAAFSAVTAYEILGRDNKVWPVALAAGLALAFSPLVWGQATVTEVYALNLAVLSIFLWYLFCRRSAWLTGFLLGLAMTTHLTSLFMLPIGIVLTPQGQRRRLALGILIGLIPLLALPLLGQLGSPVIWGDPSTIKGWWWLVTAQLYRANLVLPDTMQALLPHLSEWGASTTRQFASIGWFFVILGIFAQQLGKRRLGWLLATAVTYAAFSFIYSTNDAILNFLPALLLLTPLLAAGLNRLGIYSLLFPLLLLILNFQSQNLTNDHQVRLAAASVMPELPANALVLTPGDHSIFSLWYFQHVEGIRPDLILVDANLLAFNWYRAQLAVRYPELKGLLGDNLPLFKVLNAQIRPFCELSLQNPHGVSCQNRKANLSAEVDHKINAANSLHYLVAR